jgi:tyrosine-protein phosphatase YwqE
MRNFDFSLIAMGIFSFFSSKNKTPDFDFSLLGADMHSHLLPGIDDGSKSLDETIGMILKMKDLGYKKLFFTPHVMEGFYPNTRDSILGALDIVKKEVERLEIDIQIDAAAEYFYDETLLERMDQEELLTFAGRHVLFEFPFHNEPFQIDKLIKKFKEKGYIPVLAHFERYIYYHNREELFSYFRSNGVRLQLNLLSLTGHYGPDILKQAKRMVDLQVIDFVGTDCHRIEHLQIIEKAKGSSYFKKLSDLDLINDKL